MFMDNILLDPDTAKILAEFVQKQTPVSRQDLLARYPGSVEYIGKMCEVGVLTYGTRGYKMPQKVREMMRDNYPLDVLGQLIKDEHARYKTS